MKPGCIKYTFFHLPLMPRCVPNVSSARAVGLQLQVNISVPSGHMTSHYVRTVVDCLIKVSLWKRLKDYLTFRRLTHGSIVQWSLNNMNLYARLASFKWNLAFVWKVTSIPPPSRKMYYTTDISQIAFHQFIRSRCDDIDMIFV